MQERVRFDNDPDRMRANRELGRAWPGLFTKGGGFRRAACPNSASVLVVDPTRVDSCALLDFEHAASAETPTVGRGPGPDPDSCRCDSDRRSTLRRPSRIGRAWRAMSAARVFFFTIAVVNAVIFTVFLLVAAGPGRLVPRTTIFVVVFGLLAALWLCAGLRVRREPRVRALVGAVMQTLAAVATRSSIHAFLAAGCWAVVAAVAPLPRLLRQHPDLRISAKIRAERKGTPRTRR